MATENSSGVSDGGHGSSEASPPPSQGPQDELKPLKLLVYSDDRGVRQQVLSSLGGRPDQDLPPVSYVECATEPMVITQVDAQRFDLVILDGEATPAGGMGIARQLKDEIYQCPPILVLIGRPQDGWLATWSRADAVVSHPLDPRTLAKAAADLLKRRIALPS